MSRLCGYKHTEKTKKKMSLASKGKKKNYVIWNKGLTKETDIRVNEYSKKRVGNSSGMKGRKNPCKLETRRKISEKAKGRKMSQEVKNRISKANMGHLAWNKGKTGTYKHTKEAKIRIAESRMGNKHPLWKGGTVIFKEQIRSLPEYKEWRLMIFGRDNFTCQCCGERGGYLEAHHIEPLCKIIEQYNLKYIAEAQLCEVLWDINNGLTLCKKCHNKTKKGRYFNEFMSDVQ